MKNFTTNQAAFRSSLSEKIKSGKKQYNFTYQELADKLDVSVSCIKNYLNGTSVPSSYGIAILAELFHTTPNELLGWSTENAYKSMAKQQLNYALTKMSSVHKDFSKILEMLE